MNGGLNIELSGNRWAGEKLDASTSNGGVTLTIPENYSARIETGTVNGGMKTDYPMNVRGEIGGQRMTFDVGSGGPTIRAVTTNGGVKIQKATI